MSYRSGWSRELSLGEALKASWIHDQDAGVTQVGPQRAEVRREGTVGRDAAEDFRLHPTELHDGVAAKTAPVENERGIVDGGRGHRHRDLVPRGNDLPPMAQAELRVEALEHRRRRCHHARSKIAAIP